MWNVIKWVGTKRNVTVPIVNQLKRAGEVKRYFEPFCGSLSVGLAYRHTDSYFFDNNVDLINFYNVIRDEDALEEFIELFLKFENNKDYFMNLRGLYNTMPRPSVGKIDISRAAMFYYFCSFSFRGMTRYNKKGGINSPYGDIKSTVPLYWKNHSANILHAHKYLKRQVVECRNVFDLDLNEFGEGDLFYLDPPYPSTTKPYYNSFPDEAYEKLGNFVRDLTERGCKIVMTSPTDVYQLSSDPRFTVLELKYQNRLANATMHDLIFKNF